jgi:hypothetical protein
MFKLEFQQIPIKYTYVIKIAYTLLICVSFQESTASSINNITLNCSNANLINFTQPSIRVNTSDGIPVSYVFGITEVVNDTSYFFITDEMNHRGN